MRVNSHWMWLGLGLAWTLSACGSGSATTGTDKGETDSGGSGDDGGDDGSGDDTAEAVEGPSILDLDAYCYINDEGEEDEYIAWVVAATGAHSEGAWNLEAFQTEAVTVSSEGSDIASYAIVCDDNGGCSGTWSSQEHGIGCVDPEQYTVEVVLTDSAGLTSDPSSVEGRKADDAGG